MMQYTGACFCRKIHFTLQGEPLFTQYCHCNKCRKVASHSQRAADKIGYNFTAAYLTDNFQITEGLSELETLGLNHSNLMCCEHCHSLLYGISQDQALQAGIGVNINNIDFVDELLPESFQPDKHIWYSDRIADCEDTLPKYKNSPKEQGGTGELI